MWSHNESNRREVARVLSHNELNRGEVVAVFMEICKGVISITTLPLDSFRQASLDGVKCGHELCAKVWGSSECTASNAMKRAPEHSLLTCGLLDRLMVGFEHGAGHIECGWWV